MSLSGVRAGTTAKHRDMAGPLRPRKVSTRLKAQTCAPGSPCVRMARKGAQGMASESTSQNLKWPPGRLGKHHKSITKQARGRVTRFPPSPPPLSTRAPKAGASSVLSTPQHEPSAFPSTRHTTSTPSAKLPLMLTKKPATRKGWWKVALRRAPTANRPGQLFQSLKPLPPCQPTDYRLLPAAAVAAVSPGGPESRPAAASAALHGAMPPRCAWQKDNEL